MRFILTNDDGIDAPGLRALEEAARQIGEVIVVAPAEAHSGCSHRVTTNALIRIHPAGPNRFAVEATPADCVRVALHRFGPEPAWVLSGVNEGGNLGADVLSLGHGRGGARGGAARLDRRRLLAVQAQRDGDRLEASRGVVVGRCCAT